MINEIYDNQRETILLSYMAGIFDGEGSVILERSNPKDMISPKYVPRISMGMTDEIIIDMFHQRYGGCKHLECVQGRKVIYRWAITGSKAINIFLNDLMPYLIVKKERALILKEFMDTKEYIHRGKPLPTEELCRREEFYQKIKKLNAYRVPATTNRADNREVEVIV